jgi:phospholipid/cholesterol/gamma-HCH transport system substrate-binding protein
MNNKRNEFLAGLFIIVTIALAVTVILLIHGVNAGATRTVRASWKLTDDIGGLRVGDDVRVGGLKVGQVRDVRVEDADGTDPHIAIVFTIPANYSLHSDAIVQAQSSLTGAADLNIESFGTGSALADGQVLVGIPDSKTSLFASLGRSGPRIEEAISQLNSQTIPTVTQAATNAKTLLAHADSKIDPVADSTSRAAGQVADLLGDTKPDIRGTLKHLNSASGVLSEKLPSVVQQVQAVLTKVDTSLASAQVALLDIQKTAANTKDITQSLRSVIVDNHSKLDGMIASLKVTSDNLKFASVEIRHSPWRLLYKPTPEEAGNLDLYDSAREFAQGANSLDDAAGALRDALKDPQADPKQIQQLMQQLNTSFDHFHQVENKLLATAGQ